MAPLIDLSGINIDEERLLTLKWVDESGRGKELAEEGSDEDDLINKINPPMINSHREGRNLKSAIKGSG
jgi:hypothetical protein